MNDKIQSVLCCHSVCFRTLTFHPPPSQLLRETSPEQHHISIIATQCFREDVKEERNTPQHLQENMEIYRKGVITHIFLSCQKGRKVRISCKFYHVPAGYRHVTSASCLCHKREFSPFPRNSHLLPIVFEPPHFHPLPFCTPPSLPFISLQQKKELGNK